ncbi:MAG: hypothetical protein AB7V13_18985 [Pseudorhodoplanes sp.]|uniref:hypothetical protein n=1 Tax=Pseudorhodoplanes sp. TaxID=1934341 RepID=UPI003D11BAFE
MKRIITILRLFFVLLFGAMSLMHGPVMTFSGAYASAQASLQQAGHSGHVSHHAVPDCHDDQTPPARHVPCNAFACFMAVEPLPIMARPPHPILFAIMAATPTPSLDPMLTAPALPPPRLQG